jgi:hypothetical protein
MLQGGGEVVTGVGDDQVVVVSWLQTKKPVIALQMGFHFRRWWPGSGRQSV